MYLGAIPSSTLSRRAYTNDLNDPATPMATSTIRRKPIFTYQSPCSSTPIEVLVTPSSHAPPSPQPHTGAQTKRDASHADMTIPTTIIRTRPYARSKLSKGSSLPLYHPLGPLAQSLPPLDPTTLGLPSTVSVEDNTPEKPQDSGRRSSSRPRRPAAKVRDRDAADEDELIDGALTPESAPSTREAAPRTSSPRKRRAGGASGTGGSSAKRRRRPEQDEPDGPTPPAPKRARNPRGARTSTPIVGSPLASAAVATTPAEDDEAAKDTSPTPDAVDADEPAAAKREAEGEAGAEAEAEAEPTPEPVVPPKRSQRPRRSRAATSRRRNSSASATASSGTSGSAPASTTTRTTRSSKRAQERTTPDRKSVEKKEEEEGEEESHAVTNDTATAPADEAATAEAGELAADANNEDKMEGIEESVPSPPPAIAQKEEKEEGELSDE
ncbi:hypothetical protein WOLCODRAFT_164469 [Wolfiporia cocos MD-104 SS10]|uniref:Uncharacterized protein n=1 Tax=Wolfiporia cocos (strain MD-104) TaxID=742152 RepID=A0A2H3K034_WOLCO|nr:hypothetical protein WOLCODRAFT_164469 [Wolfiporia cocos MD-104 SS10]